MTNRKKTVRTNIIMIFMTLLAILLLSVTGKAAENKFKSQGKIIFDNDTENTTDDVIFDSGDFNKLAFICK